MSIEAFRGGTNPFRPTDPEVSLQGFEAVLGAAAAAPSPRPAELAQDPFSPILEERGWRAIANRAIERVVGGESAGDLAGALLDHIERQGDTGSPSDGSDRARSFQIITDHLAFWSGGLPGTIGVTPAQREAATALLDELNRQRRQRPW